MQTHLKRLANLLLFLYAAFAIDPVAAQNYPFKPLRMIVPLAAGGSSDLLARTIAQALSDALGQPVIVDNRVGAGGVLGVQAAAKAPADGYTILFGSNMTMAANTFLYKNVPFDPLKDFSPLSAIANVQVALVTSVFGPVATPQELIALAKAKPGELNYGAGTASALICTETFKSAAGIEIAKVPYRGSAQALTDLLAGRIQLVCEPLPTALQMVKSGKLRSLGVMSNSRSPFAPDWPTIAEAGIRGAVHPAWVALYIASGTPKDIEVKLVNVLGDILRNPAIKDKIKAGLWEEIPIGPEYLDRITRAEIVRLEKLVKEANISPE